MQTLLSENRGENDLRRAGHRSDAMVSGLVAERLNAAAYVAVRTVCAFV